MQERSEGPGGGAAAADREGPLVIVVMGVSGSGKTTLAHRLADRLGCRFQEGDDLHPAANVAKMRAGIPLDDGDRWPWLRSIAAVIDGWRAEGVSGVLTCSALRRRYRDLIVGNRPGVRLVHVVGSAGLLSPRLAARAGHYMPGTLLDSQFEALEPPAPEEHAITVSADQPPDAVMAETLAALGRA